MTEEKYFYPGTDVEVSPSEINWLGCVAHTSGLPHAEVLSISKALQTNGKQCENHSFKLVAGTSGLDATFRCANCQVEINRQVALEEHEKGRR